MLGRKIRKNDSIHVKKYKRRKIQKRFFALFSPLLNLIYRFKTLKIIPKLIIFKKRWVGGRIFCQTNSKRSYQITAEIGWKINQINVKHGINTWLLCSLIYGEGATRYVKFYVASLLSHYEIIKTANYYNSTYRPLPSSSLAS